MNRAWKLGVIGVFIVLGVGCLWQAQSLLYLSEAQEEQLVAGWFWRCGPGTATCGTCTIVTSCVVGGLGKFCTHVGGTDGCTNQVARKICEWTFNPYATCTNNAGPLACSGYLSYKRCVPVLQGGIISACNMPNPNGCTSIQTSQQCQDCK